MPALRPAEQTPKVEYLEHAVHALHVHPNGCLHHNPHLADDKSETALILLPRSPGQL